MVPPNPPGPMPSLLIFPAFLFPGLQHKESRNVHLPVLSVLFGQNCTFSNVPPTPTPTTIGGHAFGPASFTAVRIAFLLRLFHPQVLT